MKEWFAKRWLWFRLGMALSARSLVLWITPPKFYLWFLATLSAEMFPLNPGQGSTITIETEMRDEKEAHQS